MAAIKQLGLIGYPLSHSFSKRYFAEKFVNEAIPGWNYDLFPLESIEQFPSLIQQANFVGLNVTIPYKEQVIPYLDEIDTAAAEIGAVNTIKFINGKLKGYNTDVYGFEQSLRGFITREAVSVPKQALVLGTGGAAKAVVYVLGKMGIKVQMVSRTGKANGLAYEELTGNNIGDYQLIVNTTPLGMAPNIDAAPNIPYSELTKAHLCYDLVYNPEKTVFLTRGEERTCPIKNGLEMLVLQAEKSWEIWNAIA
ncbi:MAG: shikimate dehydrogenase [Saprospiraceae bacterium]